MWTIDIDGDEWTVPEARFNALVAEGLIEECDECSSEFSATLVAHPTSDEASAIVREELEEDDE